MTASSHLLDRREVEPTESERRALGLDRSDRAYMLERLRLADGIPMAIERAVIPTNLVKALPQGIEEGSLHVAFEKAGHIPSRASAEVTARHAFKRERDLLNLTSKSVVLLCEDRVIWDQNDLPLENTVTSYVAERYSFEAMLYRGEENS